MFQLIRNHREAIHRSRGIGHWVPSNNRARFAKGLFWGGLLAFFLSSTALAGPRWGGFESTLQADVTLGHDSNIAANNQGESAIIYRGGLDINIQRDRSDANWRLNLGTDIFRFNNRDRENTEDFHVGLDVFSTKPRFASRFQADGSINWSRTTDADPRLGTRYQRNEFSVTAGTLYSPNSKYSLRINGSYNWEDPLQAQTATGEPFSELTQWSAGFTAFYRRSEKLAFTLSGNFSDTSGGSGVNPFQSNNASNNFSLGADGQLTSKVSGSFSLGWQFRDATAMAPSESSPYVNAGLTWQIDSLTSMNINASRQFGTTVNDLLTEDQSLQLGLNRRLNSRLDGAVNLEWRQSEMNFIGQFRTDDYYIAGLSGTYTVNEWITITGRFSWTEQESSVSFFAFDRQLAELTMNLTY